MQLKYSKKVDYKGPSREAFLVAFADRKNTLVLNLEILRSGYMQYSTEESPEYKLNARINACKHYIQVYGFKSAMKEFNGKFDCHHDNFVHHHFKFNTTTLILEYYVIDEKTVLLTQLGPHENFKFGQARLKKIARIKASEGCKKTIQETKDRQDECGDKLDSMLKCKNIDPETIAKIRSTMA